MKVPTAPPASVTGPRLSTSAPSALFAMGIQILSLTAIATAAPGDLDTSFGIDGIARARIATTSGYSFERIHDLVIQPDGKIVAVGRSDGAYRQSAMARFNPDGTLDSTFGTGGKRLASTSSAHNEANAVALQSDGKIVMAGYETDYVTNISSFAVARFNSNGSFDPDFSGDGMVSLPRRVYAANEKVVAIGIQPSGKILVAGVSSESGVFAYSAVARLNEDGTLDTSFRGAGKFSEYHREPSSMLVLPDGKFLLAGAYPLGLGTGETRHWVARYSVNGALETETFTPVGGVADSQGAFGGGADCIEVDPSGTFWTSGSRLNGSDLEMVIVRYSSGISGGTVTVGPLGRDAKMAFQPNGKLVALSRSFLVRFDQTPELDATFSENGTLEVPVSQPQAVVCQGNGSILVSGESTNYGFSIARILADGNPPTDITASPTEIAENLPAGTLVATLATTDLDAGDSSLYSLVSGTGDTDNASFSITGDQIHTTATLDFENGETRSIRVRVVDSGQSIFEKVISIAVLDDLSEDIDGDGLNQAQENLYGSSDFSLDSDGDGIGDYVEVNTYHSSPGSADSDGDGINDGDEISRGTGIIDPDSDDDGLIDGQEIARGADPLNPDSDGDGFLDGYEVQTGKSPTDPMDKPALVAEVRTAIEFTFPAAIGKSYRIEDSPDMTTWGLVEDGIEGTGGVVTRFYTTRYQQKRFFRVEESP